jgi:two-component system, cell cycle response regulator
MSKIIMTEPTAVSQPPDILIVDDTPANLHLLARLLSDAGYRVRPFTRGEAALAAIQALPPDIILVDALMPEMDGYAVCSQLKADPHTRDIPIIFLSALNETENKIRAFETGAVDYITKPFQIPEVLARIRNQLQIGELQRQYQQQNARLQEEINERRRAQESLIHQAEEISTLYRLSLLITSGLDFSYVLDTLHDQLCKLMPIDVFYLALYNAETDMIHIPVYFERDDCGRLSPDATVPAFTARPTGFAAHILRTCQMLHVADTLDPNSELPAQPVHLGGVFSRSYLGIPLMWKDQIIGLLSVQSYQTNAYTSDHIRLIQAIAVQSAIAIQNVHLYEEAQTAREVVESTNQELQKALIELEQLATTDKLTGAYNRRKFDEIVNAEIKRALRFSSPLSLIMFDIDHFKTVNDSFGHHTGDKVLVEVVRLVVNSIRSSDTLTRWGGEEFLVLSPGNNLEQTLEMAERLRQIIDRSSFPSVTGVTISLGVCEFCPGDTPDQLINRADNALYRAKNDGRNCVSLALDPKTAI